MSRSSRVRRPGPRTAPRLCPTREFLAAVRADERGIVRLARLCDINSYMTLTRLLWRQKPATPLNRARLQQLATVINFTGAVVRGFNLNEAVLPEVNYGD